MRMRNLATGAMLALSLADVGLPLAQTPAFAVDVTWEGSTSIRITSLHLSGVPAATRQFRFAMKDLPWRWYRRLRWPAADSAWCLFLSRSLPAARPASLSMDGRGSECGRPHPRDRHDDEGQTGSNVIAGRQLTEQSERAS
jgi:hypothetical protein